MNTVAVVTKNPLLYLRFVTTLHLNTQKCIFGSLSYKTVSIDAMDAITLELVQRHKYKTKYPFNWNSSIRNFMAQDTNVPKNVCDMTSEEIENEFMRLMTKQKDKGVLALIDECIKYHKSISEIGLKKMFRNYSISGKFDIVKKLQKYCCKTDFNLFIRNGEFTHYLAKAQCMRGNSEKGLSLLTDCYHKNKLLRSFYRIIFRELIHDSVLNKSEASLVIFKKYVLKFSEQYGDHYPLVCFWHICWSSTWFSDQMVANELLDTSIELRNIVKDKATEFSISILRQQYNEDAVYRLLQVLLQYKMMEQYVKVLQVLFAHKLKTRDIRGCTEIMRNCEVLGINLPAPQQGKYIRLLIDGKRPETIKPTTDIFKFKF